MDSQLLSLYLFSAGRINSTIWWMAIILLTISFRQTFFFGIEMRTYFVVQTKVQIILFLKFPLHSCLVHSVWIKWALNALHFLFFADSTQLNRSTCSIISYSKNANAHTHIHIRTYVNLSVWAHATIHTNNHRCPCTDAAVLRTCECVLRLIKCSSRTIYVYVRVCSCGGTPHDII